MHILVVSEPWRVTLFEQPFNTHLVWSVVPALCSRAPGTINQSVMLSISKVFKQRVLYYFGQGMQCTKQQAADFVFY